MFQTKMKLEEAEYFLQKMSESISDSRVFQFNLSAFLSAFRSVTFIMQKEYQHINGFDSWYNKVQTKLKSDKEMKFLTYARNMVLKEKYPNGRIEITVVDIFTIRDSVLITKIDKNGNIVENLSSPPLPAVPTEPARSETKWYFQDFPEKDAITLCRDCLEKMRTIVEECERKFPLKEKVDTSQN